MREDPGLRVVMGEAGRAAILSELSLSKMVERHRRLCGEVLRAKLGRLKSVQAPSAPSVRPSERALRVLMLTPYPQVHGPLPILVSTLAEALRAQGCDIETALWSRHAEKESLPAKVIGRVRDLRHILTVLRGGGFDVLFVATAHTWAGLLRDVPLVLLSRPWCPRRVIHFHGSYADRLETPGRYVFKALSRTLVRNCDAVLLLSQQERIAWAAFEPGVRFEVVLNPFVSPQKGTDSSHHEGAGCDEPDMPSMHPGKASAVVLFVGRLMPEKGIFDLLEALRQLVFKGTRITLVVAGEGPAAADLRARLAAFGLDRQVDMRGYLSGAALQAAYDGSDIFALPTYWAEGFPTVILEAMHAGLPIVTTPLRGAADQLVQGQHALFVPPHRPDLLAAALERLADDEPLRLLMGCDNRLKVKDFAPEKVVLRYLRILREVADRPAVGQRYGEGR